MVNILRSTYKTIPLKTSLGDGIKSFTLFFMDSISLSQIRYEIKANTIKDALSCISDFLDTKYSYISLDENGIEVNFDSYPSYISYLFI